MPEVFISYARPTENEARRVAEALKALGFDVWLDDELLPHRPYAEVIEERLHQAKAVVVLWSQQALHSQWVRSEANHGRAANKLVQASLDGTAPPMPFDQIQYAKLNGWAGDPQAPEWRKIARSIEELTERSPDVRRTVPDLIDQPGDGAGLSRMQLPFWRSASARCGSPAA